MLIIDVVLVIILLFSIVVGYFRGFIGEILRIVVWVGAALATYYTNLHYPLCIPQVGPFVTMGLIFIGYLIVFKLLQFIIEKYVQQDFIGIVDKPLGMVYGALRGLIVLLLIGEGLKSFHISSKFMDAIYNNINTYIDLQKYEKMLQEKSQLLIEKFSNRNLEKKDSTSSNDTPSKNTHTPPQTTTSAL